MNKISAKRRSPEGGKWVPCANCGTWIWRTAFYLRNHAEFVCSGECKGARQSLRRKANRLLWVPRWSKEELVTDYVTRRMTTVAMGKKYGAARSAVWYALKFYGVPLRRSGHTGGTEVASYSGGHARVKSERGKPLRCEDCGTTDKTKRYEWASISKRYGDPMDYKRLCASCHHKMDGTVQNLWRQAR